MKDNDIANKSQGTKNKKRRYYQQLLEKNVNFGLRKKPRDIVIP